MGRSSQTPLRDSRTSLYIRIGDWPARMLAIACLVCLFGSFRDWRNQRLERPDLESRDLDADDAGPLGTVETK